MSTPEHSMLYQPSWKTIMGKDQHRLTSTLNTCRDAYAPVDIGVGNNVAMDWRPYLEDASNSVAKQSSTVYMVAINITIPITIIISFRIY